MVRDAIHSHDVLDRVRGVLPRPAPGEVYNLGGGRFSNTSHIEAFAMAEEISGRTASIKYVRQARVGDHQWCIGSTAAGSAADYPGVEEAYDVPAILREIYEANVDKPGYGPPLIDAPASATCSACWSTSSTTRRPARPCSGPPGTAGRWR